MKNKKYIKNIFNDFPSDLGQSRYFKRYLFNRITYLITVIKIDLEINFDVNFSNSETNSDVAKETLKCNGYNIFDYYTKL